MKKNILALLAMSLFNIFNSWSQTYITQVRPMGSKLWGYANQKGEMIIEPRFEKCYEFSSNGLAAVYDKAKKQFYFINTSGKITETEISGFKIKEGLLTDYKGFNDDLIQVRLGERWGYMNGTGKLVIEAKYDDASEFNQGHAIVEMSRKFFVIDTKGKETPITGAMTDVKSFREGMAMYRAPDKRMGFIGTGGQIVVAAEFESVGPFSAGLAWVKGSDGKVGFLNARGDWAIQPKYDAAKNFDILSGLARVKKGEVWTYVNLQGEEVSIACSDVLGDFSEGLADGKKGDKKGFYDNKGKWVIEPKFDGVRDFKNGFAAAKQGEHWGMIDKQGKWIIEPKFEGIRDMELIR